MSAIFWKFDLTMREEGDLSMYLWERERLQVHWSVGCVSLCSTYITCASMCVYARFLTESGRSSISCSSSSKTRHVMRQDVGLVHSFMCEERSTTTCAGIGQWDLWMNKSGNLLTHLWLNIDISVQGNKAEWAKLTCCCNTSRPQLISQIEYILCGLVVKWFVCCAGGFRFKWPSLANLSKPVNRMWHSQRVPFTVFYAEVSKRPLTW